MLSWLDGNIQEHSKESEEMQVEFCQGDNS